MKIKIIFLLFFLLYQTNSYSKNNISEKYNQKYLSDYFSARISYDNQNNDKAINFFESSKKLLGENESHFDKYISALVIEGKTNKAIKSIKQTYKQNSNFLSFESNLLFVIESLKSKKFIKAEKSLNRLNKFKEMGNFEYIIFNSLSEFIYLFKNKQIQPNLKNYGNLTLINKTLQNCYLNSNRSDEYFLNLLNSQDADFTRYNFFYLGFLIDKNNFSLAHKISNNLNSLNNTLLVSQAKEWIENNKYELFTDYFKCNSENDLLAEFFFLIANLYSSEEDYKKSNYYLNISKYLNPKFYFNTTLEVENYLVNERFKEAKNLLKKMSDKNLIYNWYKIKQNTKIISKLENDELAFKYLNKKFKEFKNPSTKIIFDMANYFKNKKKYEIAIKYYTEVLGNLSKNSNTYSDVLYKRGACFERLGRHVDSDTDLLNALKINPDDSYLLNYLAYSWLERNYKIDEAITLLKKAYNLNKNDPYIIDSIGWGYYLINDFDKAESYMIQAVQLMPLDPVVNDHYGDILWKLNRKLEAKYFWKNTLDLEKTDEEMKKKILIKLLQGIPKT